MPAMRCEAAKLRSCEALDIVGSPVHEDWRVPPQFRTPLYGPEKMHAVPKRSFLANNWGLLGDGIG